IVGLAGLMGSGRSELARILFGLDPHASGQIVLGGERIDRLSTRDRIKRGMAFVTESRRDDGLFIEQPIDPNLSIVSPRSGALDALVKSLQVRFSNRQEQPVKQLSGGNQQKIALGKWLVSTPRVLILDEPTRGIDVGAKLEIYRIIQDLAQQGVAVLMISSEMEELIGTCDRIAVMRKGELQSSFEMTRFDREEILRAAL
ncbi:MAG TPA: ATP-binding cassette domain-containing protein, partial [Bryobacteraceae bacterium]|nr:ATP-binding cassette domain-containing protein [Bryobacteraceae bacterium]